MSCFRAETNYLPLFSSSSYFRLRCCFCSSPSFSSSSSSSLSALSSSPSHCPGIAFPSPLPFNQPLSRLSFSLRCFAFAATTTTWRFYSSRHHHVEVLSQLPLPPLRPHHHVSLSLWYFLLLPPRRTTIEGYLFL